MKSNKLLVVCGPTATGKTKLALYLAKIFKGEIISADSRQVYKGMDIGTGKNINKISNFPRFAKSSQGEQFPIFNLRNIGVGYYIIDGVRVWGYDLVSPKQDFSVAHYLIIVKKIILNIRDRNKLPIVVGGTGLYIRAIVDGISTIMVPRNSSLRKSLDARSCNELFEILAQFDPIRAASLNSSDRGNPRRLIRAIEISQYTSVNKLPIHRCIGSKEDVLMIGLYTNKKMLNRMIAARVGKRINAGFNKEVINLLESGVGWDSQAMQSLGYKQWRAYFDKRETKREVVDNWTKQEIRYAKRQMTWFKKDKRIIWFDISKEGYRKDVENTVKKWYPLKVKGKR